jgi:2-oxoglutarate dehydrogenase E1 component
MTPKSMLRLKAASSPVEDFTTGTFREVLPDDVAAAAGGVDRVLLCSGKVYWDLVARRRELGDQRTAIVRFEQLYPLRPEAVDAALAPYGDAELVWVQEEPANQGAWGHMAMNLTPIVGRALRVVSRPASASPAAGSAKKHQAEQSEILDRAFQR